MYDQVDECNHWRVSTYHLYSIYHISSYIYAPFIYTYFIRDVNEHRYDGVNWSINPHLSSIRNEVITYNINKYTNMQENSNNKNHNNDDVLNIKLNTINVMKCTMYILKNKSMLEYRSTINNIVNQYINSTNVSI